MPEDDVSEGEQQVPRGTTSSLSRAFSAAFCVTHGCPGALPQAKGEPRLQRLGFPKARADEIRRLGEAKAETMSANGAHSI
jgi:hypothetical protein